MEMGEDPRVLAAANVFRELCYDHRDSLSAGIIVGGWDKRNGGQVSTKTRHLGGGLGEGDGGETKAITSKCCKAITFCVSGLFILTN